MIGPLCFMPGLTFRTFKNGNNQVEPQGIEPWSREDDNRIFYMLS